ncbi:MAG: DUF5069 domain-containing protein [Opitutales bacterium]
MGKIEIQANDIMKHYNYQQRLKSIWEDAVSKYEAGNREPEGYFDADTLNWLKSNGLDVMDVYDYAEDYVGSGEPDFTTFAQICEIRRDYFFQEQSGVPSDEQVDMDNLPAKDSEIEGIVWLPRILPKARGKLRGELPADLMYSCGGDRKFLKDNDLHPAEFLSVVWNSQGDDRKVIDYVARRRKERETVESPS